MKNLLMLFANVAFIVRIIRSKGRHPVDNIYTTRLKFKAGGANIVFQNYERNRYWQVKSLCDTPL
jgi:hypothetical protein